MNDMDVRIEGLSASLTAKKSAALLIAERTYLAARASRGQIQEEYRQACAEAHAAGATAPNQRMRTLAEELAAAEGRVSEAHEQLELERQRFGAVYLERTAAAAGAGEAMIAELVRQLGEVTAVMTRAAALAHGLPQHHALTRAQAIDQLVRQARITLGS